MSGHSHWAKEKHGKEDRDRQKGNLFGKLSKSITMAVIKGGGIGDPEMNAGLKAAIENARQNSMPKDNIDRAIEHASGPNKADLKEGIYEAFGPYGVGLLIKVTTDNTNRAYAELKTILDRNGGKIATQGAVQYLFQGTEPLFPIQLRSEQFESVQTLIEHLEDHDDVDEVYTNAVSLV